MNGMIMPAQMQLGQVASTTNANLGDASSPMQTGEFGILLASMTNAQAVTEQSGEKAEDLSTLLADMLDIRTVEQLEAFLQSNGYEQGELLEVIGEYILFHDESLIELLGALIPDFEQLSQPIEGEAVSVDFRELFAALEEMSTDILLKVEQQELPENLSKDDLIMLFAVVQMAAIEGPKVDLTMKQEQALHALQEMLGKLTAHLGEAKQQEQPKQMQAFSNKQPIIGNPVQESVARQTEEATTQTTRLSQDSQPLTRPANEGISQASFSIGANATGEAAKIDGEMTGNSRAEQLLKELQNVFKRANFGQANGTSRISIKLYPEHLGQLRIELLQTNGLLTARILASNALGKDMLESQLHQLRQAFLQQNIQVERIDISQMMTETPYGERHHAFNQHFKQDQEQTNEEHSKEDEEEFLSFSEYMIELEG